ncbi:phage/plasmid primase, P4 family [Halobacterium sp. NMX12-1]|uniref:Phage/plasmid primase, P4 family n=1 Tax=Halobacterium sp. NMX12-1 TaxID=3166650 RepID=A0AAU8CE33_9EURY
MTDRETLASRLRDASLLEKRLIPVEDGGKASKVYHNDTRHRRSSFEDVTGNYGVYAGATPDGGRWLIDVDIDDYSDDADSDALEAVDDLPDTLTIESPHTDGETGGHRYYYIEGKDVHESIEGFHGAKNPSLSWGEIRVHNQYVVGPGSQLDGCSKEWCDSCEESDGGHYQIATDARVAEITLADLFEVLQADEDDGNTPQTAGGVDTSRDTPNADGSASHARAVAEHYSNIEDYLQFGSDDRSESDFHVCCRFIEHGVPESEAYQLLAKNGNSKVDATDASQNYWQQTWQRAKQQVGSDADTETLPSQSRADGGSAAVNPTHNADRTGFSGEDATDGDKRTDTHDVTWSDVYERYQNAENSDEKNAARYDAAEVLLQNHNWRTFEENDTLWWYDPSDGIYRQTGESQAREMVRESLRDKYARNEVREILSHLRAATTVTQDEMGGPAEKVAVANGVLDIADRELSDHDPAYNFLSRLGTEYDPDADCPRFKQFLDEVVADESAKKKLQEFAGFTLMHWRLKWHKALFIVGPRNSGKSTFADTISALHGEDTVASLSPQEMTQRFGGAELYGKWVNIRNDIPASAVKKTGTFKEIIAGDPVKAERKGKDPFRFNPTAKHIFAANQLPDTENDDGAFYRRILLVAFPRTVPREDRDRDLDEKLEAELPGILNWALDGLQRLREQDGFTGDLTPSLTAEKWDKWGSTVDRFASACLDVGDVGNTEPIPKDTVYQVYQNFCEQESMPPEMSGEMTSRLKTDHGVSDGRATVNGTQKRCYLNVSFTAKADAYRSDTDAGGRSSSGFGGFE